MSNKIFLGNIRGPQGAPGKKGDPGEKGKRGSRWFTGTAVTGISTTGTIFETGIDGVLQNDYYLNTQTGNYYRCTVGGTDDVAEWIFIGNLNTVSLDSTLKVGGMAADSKSVGEAIDKTSNDINELINATVSDVMETISNNRDSLQDDVEQINTLLNNVNEVLTNYNEYINNNKTRIDEIIKHVGCSRNKLYHNAKSQTIGNLTFTVNDDKSITINGSGNGSGSTMFYLIENGSWEDYTIPGGDYVLTGSVPGTNGCQLFLEVIYNDGYRNESGTAGGNLNINIVDDTLCRINSVKMVISKDAKINNMTVYPALFKKNETDQSYEPGLPDRLEILEAKMRMG